MQYCPKTHRPRAVVSSQWNQAQSLLRPSGRELLFWGVAAPGPGGVVTGGNRPHPA